MARRRTPRRRARGGDVVQAPRPTRARLITGAAALAIAGGLAAYPVPRGGSFSGFLALGGGLGAALVAVAVVVGWEELLPWGLLVLGAQFAGSLYVPGGATAGSAPLYATGLLLVGELTAWSLSSRTRMREESSVVLRRFAFVGGSAIVSAAIGVVLVALATQSSNGGLGWTTVGTAATVGAVALVVRAART